MGAEKKRKNRLAKRALALMLGMVLVLEADGMWVLAAENGVEAEEAMQGEGTGERVPEEKEPAAVPDVSGGEDAAGEEPDVSGGEDVAGGKPDVSAGDETSPAGEEEIIASGEYGGISWVIDGNWLLTISGTEEQRPAINPGWQYYKYSVTSAKVTAKNVKSTCMWFDDFRYLESVDLSEFDTSNITNMRDMFRDCHVLNGLDLSRFDTGRVTDMSGMFAQCRELTNLDVSHFDTGKVTDMSSMFYNCCALESLDVSHFDTSMVRDMGYMFVGYRGLDLDLSHFDTGNVTRMSGMFKGCKALTNLDLSHFDTGKVTDMNSMFDNCPGLVSLDLSNFDTRNVTDMGDMLCACEALQSLDLSHFDTGKVTDMRGMFYGCNALTSLDLSHFDVGNVTQMGGMFGECLMLGRLCTPRNIHQEVELPSVMYDSDGNAYDMLPMERTDSVLLCRNYTVVYQLNGHGAEIAPVSVKAGEKLTAPEPEPYEKDYIFDGWYKDEACTEVWDFAADVVLSDITLYAKWTENVMYTVSFNLQGHGAEMAPCSVKAGEKLTAPEPEPYEEGYIFGGWYKDEACTEVWDFAADVVDSDIVLYARWTGDRSTVTPSDVDDTYYAQDTRRDLAALNCQISDIRPKVYDGRPYLPAVKVTATVDGRAVVLTEGADYRLLYRNNVNAGTGTVRIKGNGSYKGEIGKDFQIIQKSIARLKVTAGGLGRNASTDDIPVCLYDGGYQLEKGKDFTIEPVPAEMTRNKGKFEVTVTAAAEGNYKGSRKVKVTVYNKEKVLQDGDVTVVKPALDYNGKAQQCSVTVTYGGQPLEAKNYSVKYTNNREAGTAYVTVTGKREYGGCVVKTFEIRPVSGEFGIKARPKDVTYNGRLQKPKLVVTGINGKPLKAGRDYLLLYNSNLHAGKAAVTIRGLGNYARVKVMQVSFDILPQQIGRVSVKGTKEKLTVTYAKKLLREGVDYTLEWGEEEKNRVSVTISGMNDFKGAVVKKIAVSGG